MGKLAEESRYDEIREAVADFIEDFGIRLYPFSVFSLLKRMGIKFVSYSSLCEGDRILIESQYPDAVTRHPSNYDVTQIVVFYNDNKRDTRIRFTLAHELAHIILEHPDTGEEKYETEADIFANYLLGPAPIVIRDSKNDTEIIMDDFNVGYECARSIQDRTRNRIRCKKPVAEYEYRILSFCELSKEGGNLAYFE